VYLGCEYQLKIVGYERVFIKFLDEKVNGINGVQHNPNFPRNLIYIIKYNDLSV
jgi:hypothetical protein